MKEVKVYEEDIQEAYREGCEDVKKTLRVLYPGLRLGEKDYSNSMNIPPVDITEQIQWKPRRFGVNQKDTYYWLLGYYNGLPIFLLTHDGIGFNDFNYASVFEIIAPIVTGGKHCGFKVLRR